MTYDSNACWNNNRLQNSNISSLGGNSFFDFPEQVFYQHRANAVLLSIVTRNSSANSAETNSMVERERKANPDRFAWPNLD